MGSSSSKSCEHQKKGCGGYPKSSGYPTQGAGTSSMNPDAPPAYQEKPTNSNGQPMPPPTNQYGMGNAPPPYMPQQQVVQTGDAFEAGARFKYGSKPVIPPPPPGIMPNAAQHAAAQGHQVVVGQRETTLMDGTGYSGATVW